MKTLILAGCIVAWLFLFIPSILYLCKSWQHKFLNLKSIFSNEALTLYFQKFYPSEIIAPGTNLTALFENKFKLRYGRSHYLLPLLLLAILSGLAIALITISIFKWLELDSNAQALPPIAVSALAGAYMWVSLDQIHRYRTRDFTPHDVYICCYRFVLAIPLGFGFAAIVQTSLGVPVAFFLGAFPAQSLSTFGKRFVTKNLGIGDNSDDAKSELEQIQGVNRLEAERYQEEGITNILELAYFDPVDLTIRTNFEFNYVIDTISQSLLWLYIGKDMDKLRLLGFRGAYEARVLKLLFDSTDQGQQQMAEDNLREIARVLAVDEKAFKKTLFEVAEDPYSKFIFNAWC